MSRTFTTVIIVLIALTTAIFISFFFPWSYSLAFFFYTIGAWTIVVGLMQKREKKSYEIISNTGYKVLIGGLFIDVATVIIVSTATTDSRIQVLTFLIILIAVLLAIYYMERTIKNVN
ncbi:MAG: hypothetical protein ACPLZG_07020 [Thermoproteota archaeon]